MIAGKFHDCRSASARARCCVASFLKAACRAWARFGRYGYVGCTAGVPQKADDLLQRPSRQPRAISCRTEKCLYANHDLQIVVRTSTLPVAPSLRFFPCLQLQRVRRSAGQAPGHARGRVTKVNLPIHAALRHRFHNYGAEPAPLRRRYGRAITLGPAHGESVAIGPPADNDMTRIRRERPVFPRIGGELVERQPDGLGGSRLHAQLGAIHDDPRANKICEMRDLGARQVLDVYAAPITPHQQVLIG
jgi:hypothetical protein